MAAWAESGGTIHRAGWGEIVGKLKAEQEQETMFSADSVPAGGGHGFERGEARAVDESASASPPASGTGDGIRGDRAGALRGDPCDLERVMEHRRGESLVSVSRGRYGTGVPSGPVRGATALLSPLERFYGPLAEVAEVTACPACGGRPCTGCGAVALDLFSGEEVVPLITEKTCANPALWD